ncbi:MAG: tetratricopeptide repeat protein [Acidobacteria bacterium]|nr:tetratricopeptide repeat protein [Acidobacteriota bacterium]
MARSFDRIERAPIFEDWTEKNSYFHKASNQHFVMFRRDGRFFQRRYQLDPAGREINSFEREIHFVLGSGNKERDYLHRLPSGELVQLPVVWYSQEKLWGIAPGYDNANHEGFSRRLDFRCIFCHNAYPKLPAGAGRYEAAQSRFPEVLPDGIDCERCHGPGSRHAVEPRAANIVNPSRLDRSRQLDICMQCHLETSSALIPDMVVKLGRGVFSFRPGESLHDYAVFFDYPARSGHDDDFNIVHQAYRLRKSACFRRSEMTCTTCHDPHRVPENKSVFYNSKCQSCHKSTQTHGGENCVGCHMPQRRTDDVVRVVMTDHYIQRQPAADLLAMRAERSSGQYAGPFAFYFPEQKSELYEGIGLVRGPDVKRGVELLERVVAREKLRFVEPFLYLADGYQMLRRFDRAVENYRRALALDPDYVEARFNLGAALMARGEIAEAVRTFEEVIRRRPELVDAYPALAAAKLQAGTSSLEEVRAINLRALEFDPSHVVVLNNLGLIALQQGRRSEAESRFRQTLEVQPTNVTALSNLQRLRQ